MIDEAEVRRYLTDDESEYGIPFGVLVLTMPLDDDKLAVIAVLPDGRDPGCSAYLSDLGPPLVTTEVTFDSESPYACHVYDIPGLISAAEAREHYLNAVLSTPGMAEALRTLRAAGVTPSVLADIFQHIQ